MKGFLFMCLLLATVAAIAQGLDGDQKLKFSDVFGKTVVAPTRISLNNKPMDNWAGLTVNAKDPIPKAKLQSLSFLDNLGWSKSTSQ